MIEAKVGVQVSIAKKGRLLPDWKKILMSFNWQEDRWGNWKNRMGTIRMKVKVFVVRYEVRRKCKWICIGSFLLPKRKESK